MIYTYIVDNDNRKTNDNDIYIYINRMIGNDKHKIQPVLVFRWTVLATNLPILLLDMWCSD